MAVICYQNKQKHPNAKNLEYDPQDRRGKCQTTNSNGQTISKLPDIANTIANAISFNSSTKNYSPIFQQHKTQAEQYSVSFIPDNTESYNHPIQLEECKDAINSSKDSSPGPDNIHYRLLRHLPLSSLKLLLSIFNHHWTTDTFPNS